MKAIVVDAGGNNSLGIYVVIRLIPKIKKVITPIINPITALNNLFIIIFLVYLCI